MQKSELPSSKAPIPAIVVALTIALTVALAMEALAAKSAPLGLATEPVPQAPHTDIVILDIHPHLDHLHAGSLVQVTEREGYDNQPFFLDDDRLLFVSDREAEQTDVFMYSVSEDSVTRVTRTPESEYSPRLTPSGDHLSVVRVEADGVSQHLYRFPFDGDAPRPAGEPERVLPTLADIGYYAWAGEDHLALFRVGGAAGEPSSLHLADLGAGAVRHVQDDIDRTLQTVPGEEIVSFVDRSVGESRFLRTLDVASGQVSTVAQLPDGGEHAWVSSATLLMASEGTLYRFTGSQETPWASVLELEAMVGRFSRIAVSPSGRRIAIVVEVDR